MKLFFGSDLPDHLAGNMDAGFGWGMNGLRRGRKITEQIRTAGEDGERNFIRLLPGVQGMNGVGLAGGGGFEPPSATPKAAVLPLDDPPENRRKP